MTRIAVHGAAGRMGRNIVKVLAEDKAATLVSAMDRADHAALGQDAGVLAGLPEPLGVALTASLRGALEHAEVVIDFSLPMAARALFDLCAERRIAAVVGTTGLDSAAKHALDALCKVAPVVAAPNYSIGVNVLWALAAQAVRLLGPEFDVEIVEMHHKHKVDAPSGTAVRLTEVVAQARGLDINKAVTSGRSGLVGARRPDEIGVLALRGGDVVGDHTLVLAGPGERIELTHRAHTREIFARGAVRAAHWVTGRAPGLYEMADVLGIAAS
ncbi:MAG TPA: 4-hydroxy-tetrahydrodipicolinate reductase [Polyangiales bacterium]|jgi:4-hydroxy-tetrahydrodipicolinate reductase|nr:4-hydroxy-tetrahydrodipicolinate reductase [Polyangiales bacterium]